MLKQHTNHMEDDINSILQDKQFHLQLKSEQKEIIQNVLERKHSTIFPYTLLFRHFTFKHLSRDFEITTITAMYHGRCFAYMILPCPKWEGGERNTCCFRSPWVTLPLNVFFPTHFVLFPSALIWAVDGTVCPAEYCWYRPSPMIHCGNRSYLKVTWQMFESEMTK
jgi:hypothetical protein